MRETRADHKPAYSKLMSPKFSMPLYEHSGISTRVLHIVRERLEMRLIIETRRHR